MDTTSGNVTNVTKTTNVLILLPGKHGRKGIVKALVHQVETIWYPC